MIKQSWRCLRLILSVLLNSKESISMKVSGREISEMDEECSSGKTVHCTKGIGRKMLLMALEDSFMLMEMFMWGSG